MSNRGHLIDHNSVHEIGDGRSVPSSRCLPDATRNAADNRLMKGAALSRGIVPGSTAKSLLMESDIVLVLRNVNEQNWRLRATLERIIHKTKYDKETIFKEYKQKVADAIQQYEDAKVVVLTLKGSKIRLECVVEWQEKEIERLKSLLARGSKPAGKGAGREKLDMAERDLECIAELLESDRNGKITLYEEESTKLGCTIKELTSKLEVSEEQSRGLQEEISQLKSLLHTRSAEVDHKDRLVAMLCEKYHIPEEDLQWEPLGQHYQQSHPSVQQWDEAQLALVQLRRQLEEKEGAVRTLQQSSSSSSEETVRRMKEKGLQADKVEELRMKIESQQNYIDQQGEDVNSLREVVLSRENELRRSKDAIKGFQDLLLKEQQSHQDSKAIVEGYSKELQQLKSDLDQEKQQNNLLRTKIGEIIKKFENSEMEYAILKSLDLQSRKDMQKYKEQVITMQRDLANQNHMEQDLYRELDEAVKDFEGMSKRCKSLQAENAELKRSPSVPQRWSDDQLVQELHQKNSQVEVLHGQVKHYADQMDRERKRADMLARENEVQRLQVMGNRHPSHMSPPVDNHRFATSFPQAGQREHSHSSMIKHAVSSDLVMRPPITNPYPSEVYRGGRGSAAVFGTGGRGGTHAFAVPRNVTSPGGSDRPYQARTMPQGDTSSSNQISPCCPLCNKHFGSTDELIRHAATCTGIAT